MPLASTKKKQGPPICDVPEWFLQYRIAWDGRAYSREEFRNYYGSQHFRVYWNEAVETTLTLAEANSVFRHRTKKVAAALRWHTRFDEAIIENIMSFATVRCVSAEWEAKYLGFLDATRAK